MKSKSIAILFSVVLATTICGCSILRAVGVSTVDEAVRTVEVVRGIFVTTDTARTIIRQYPQANVQVKCGVDSVYQLPSGDRLHVWWAGKSTARVWCEIVNDTIKIK